MPITGRCYIVTVGTSLLLNRSLPSLDDPLFEESISGWQADDAFEQHFLNKASRSLRADIDTIRNQLKTAAAPTSLRRKSAELAALFGKPGEEPFSGGSDDSIYLIATRTLPGAFCGLALRDFLASPAPTGSVELRFPRWLGSADRPEFAERGLPEFLNLCFEIVERERDVHKRQVVLLPNGGYKTLLGYLTVLGLLQELPIRYVYEDSLKLLDLPNLPLGLDVHHWLRERNHFLPYVGEPWDPRLERYRGIVEIEERNSQQITALTKLGTWLEVQYQSAQNVGPLERLAKYTSLHPLLKDPRDPDAGYSRRFLRLAELGPAVWHGDRLTDMVDHAARHHYDLFDLAERVLLPLFNRAEKEEQSPFLAPHELFLLLGALYLHDCGNVVGYLPQTGPLTSQLIRRHHHLLGYLRLQRGPEITAGQPDWCLSAAIYDWLLNPNLPDAGDPWNWPGKGPERQKLRDYWLNPIAALGVYHSSSAPLLALADPGQRYQFLFKVPPLTDEAGTLLPLLNLQLKCGTHQVPGNDCSFSPRCCASSTAWTSKPTARARRNWWTPTSRTSTASVPKSKSG